MKKQFLGRVFTVLCLTMLLVLCCALAVSAETYSGDCGAEGSNVTWSLDTETGVLTISGEGKMKDYNVELEDYAPWYSYCYSIGRIEISEGITKIGNNTFNFTQIIEMHIPASVTEIEKWVFCGCDLLEKITVADGNKVFVAKNNCIIDATNGVLIVGCKNSTIPDDGSIVEIGTAAFQECGISSVTIPESVKRIGGQAFYGSNITSLHIPASVEMIENLITGGCESLESITVDAANENYYSENNCVITKDTKIIVAGCKTSTLSNEITEIGAYAFADNFGMNDITVPASVTKIGTDAFRNAGLDSITILNPNTVIEDDFMGTIAETAIIHGAKGSTAQAYAEKYGRTFVECVFGDCGADGDNITWMLNTETGVLTISGEGDMKSHDVSQGWESDIPSYYQYRNLVKSVVISDGVTGIGNRAFSGLYNITELNIPASVTSFGRFVLTSCSNLEKITVAEGNEYFVAKDNCLIKLSDGELVAGCKTSVIPNDGSVKIIGTAAFQSHAITAVTIPDGVRRIEGQAFCSSGITSLHIPASVKSIDEFVTGNCNSLESITVDADNEYFYSEDNCIISKAEKKLLAGCKNSTVPDDTVYIAAGAFDNISGLKEVTIPVTVREVGAKAFRNSGVTDVTFENVGTVIHDASNTFPSTVTIHGVIDSEAYKYAKKYGRTFVSEGNVASGLCGANSDDVRWSLDFESGVLTISGEGEMQNCYKTSRGWRPYLSDIKKVVIENSVTKIGENAFTSCYRMESIEISDGVTTIGAGAFKGCVRLTAIEIPASVTNIVVSGDGLFAGSSNLSNITVDENNPVYYSENNCIIEKETKKLVIGSDKSIIPEDVVSIGACAFSGCDIASLNIPASVVAIDSNAFLGTSVAEITVAPENKAFFFNGEMLVRKSNNSIVAVLTGLESVTIPEYVTVLSPTSFRYCTELKEVKVDANNPTYYADDNCIIRKGNNKLVMGNKEGRIPDYVTIIGEKAFCGMNSITSITVPESVKQIDAYAFFWCNNLTDITVNGFIDHIGNYAFANNENKSVNVTFAKQKNKIDTWAANWSKNVSDRTGIISFVWGDELHIPDGYHLCADSKVVPSYWDYEDGVLRYGCVRCDEKTEYTFSDAPILDLDFETPIEDNVNGDIGVEYRYGNLGEFVDGLGGGKAYKPATVFFDDSGSHLMFAPERLYVSLDVMFDTDNLGSANKESVLTFIYGYSGDTMVGSASTYEWVLRYYKGSDGIAKLSYYDDPDDNCVIIEDEKWYHCEIIAEADSYKIFIDGVKLGSKTRTDYTLAKYNGGTTLRLADNKGTGVVIDNLLVTQINAADCGDNHKYTNVCDTDCNVCGKVRIAEHSVSEIYVKDGRAHWYECSLCGTRRNEAEHSYESVSDVSCDACGYERTLNHEYETTYSYDENGHWNKCSICGNKKNETEHIYVNSCDADCDVCGYEREIAHTYVWEYGEDEHWQKCSVCLATAESSEHVGDFGCDEFYHWFECADCGYKAIKSTHDYSDDVDATCNTCYYEREVEVETDDPNAPSVIIESKNAIAGSQITVSFYLQNVPVLKSMLLDGFAYDEDALELVRGTWKNISGAMISNWDNKDNIATLVFEFEQSLEGVVFELVFNVKEDVEGEFEIGCNVVINKKAAVGGEQAVKVKLVKGTLYVSEIARGDVNGDGFVDSDDAIYLLRYTLAADRYPINQSGDMNGDGFTDSDDAIHLLRHTLSAERYPLSD